MIRKIAELFISHSLDNGKPLPSWLQALVQRDTRLRKFETQSRQLDAALRTSAAKHRQALATTTNPPPSQGGARGGSLCSVPSQTSVSASSAPSRTRTLRWLAPLAIAASLLLIITPNWLRPTPQTHAGEFSHHLTTVPSGVLNLITHAAKTSQTELPRLSPLANLSISKIPNWQDLALSIESPVYEKLNTLRPSWQNIKFRAATETQEL